jgi:hypothetical protein
VPDAGDAEFAGGIARASVVPQRFDRRLPQEGGLDGATITGDRRADAIDRRA